VGIVVGTRPDCVDAEKLDYFKELSRQTYLVIEYGIESLLTKTLERVNRGHDAELTKWAIEETAGRGIRTGGHMMIGLPGEERQDFLDMAEVLSHWPLNSIKFHQLQIIRGTAMEAEYRENPDEFLEFSMEEYLQLMMEILERLNPSMVVERIAGEVNPAMAAREGWGVRYDEVLRKFEALLEKHNTWQGRKYTKAL
jgi:radical SAM protein (TIGR01212 family)